jgi:heat-inducible transcriptional repressor
MISSRQAAILEAVINRYIRTAEPVGSKVIADDQVLGVSPATIRNDMAALEDMGYLVQPHTSAGRVPTDKGYRFYVDSLRKTLEIAQDDASSLLNKLAELRRLETEEMVRQVSSVMASRTCTISLVLNPVSNRVYFWGISQLLHQPEFLDTKRVEFLVELLEGEHHLAEMLSGEA